MERINWNEIPFPSIVFILSSLLLLFQTNSIHKYLTLRKKRENPSFPQLTKSFEYPIRLYCLVVGILLLGIISLLQHMTASVSNSLRIVNELLLLALILCIVFCAFMLDDYKDAAMDRLKIKELPEGMEKTRQEAYYVVITAFGCFASLKAMLMVMSLVITFAFLLLVYNPKEMYAFQNMCTVLLFIVMYIAVKRVYIYPKRFLIDSRENITSVEAVHQNNQRIEQRISEKKLLLFCAVINFILAILVSNVDLKSFLLFETNINQYKLWYIFIALSSYYLITLLVVAQYGDKYDEWVYQLLKTKGTKTSDPQSSNNKHVELPLWLDEANDPLHVQLSWKLGFIPFVLPDVTNSVIDNSNKEQNHLEEDKKMN